MFVPFFSELAELLDYPVADAERHIVDLIRAARMDAKIDSNKSQLVIGNHFPNVYQQVIDKTRTLNYRSNQLASQLEKKYAAADQDD